MAFTKHFYSSDTFDFLSLVKEELISILMFLPVSSLPHISIFDTCNYPYFVWTNEKHSHSDLLKQCILLFSLSLFSFHILVD